jgi:hypothetical protein
MNGSLFTMPILVLNMGGEMVYILNQRLQAQNVAQGKGSQVLNDVLRAMYSPIFIQELFKPQDIYTMTSTKLIFEKLAHSSIMRLNKSSMDKLYDLMFMGLKYQILSSSCPQHFIQITLNHLHLIRAMVSTSVEVTDLITSTIDEVVNLYSNFTNGQWNMLKFTLMRFFQGKRVKVSLFLQQSMQLQTGVLVFPIEGKLPYGTEIPGTIKYFENDRNVNTKRFHSDLFDVVSESDDAIDLNSKNGFNVYTKDEDILDTINNEASIISEKNIRAQYSGNSPSSSSNDSKEVSYKSQTKSNYSSSGTSVSQASAKQELSLLANLLGVSSSPSSSKPTEKKESNVFQINNLFGLSSKDGDGDGEGGMMTINIDATADSKTISQYMNDLDLNDQPKDSKGCDGDDMDDLLDLMDMAK